MKEVSGIDNYYFYDINIFLKDIKNSMLPLIPGLKKYTNIISNV